MTSDAKIAIIGAGIAGLLVARTLSKYGYQIDVYEEHGDVGFPKHCTGLVSKHVIEIIGEPAQESIESQYRKIKFVVDDIEVLHINTKEEVYRIDRVKLEKILLKELVAQDVTFYFNKRVTQIVQAPKPSIVINNKREPYDIIILAEGITGSLRKQLGVYHKPMISYGVNLDFSVVSSNSNEGISIYLYPKIPGLLYGWGFSIGSRKYSVYGALSFDSRTLSDVVQFFKKKIDSTLQSIYGGIVIHGPPLPCRLQQSNIIIVGDAAALNKPLTGGGLYPNTLFITRLEKELEEGARLETALKNAYCYVFDKLSKQYQLVRSILDGFLLASIVKIGGASGLSGRLTLDYDSHEYLISSILRQAPGRSFIAGMKLLFRKPGLAIKLLRGMIP